MTLLDFVNAHASGCAVFSIVFLFVLVCAIQELAITWATLRRREK